MTEVTQQLLTWWAMVDTYARAHPKEIVIACLVSALGVIWVNNLVHRILRKWGKPKMPMTKKERERYRQTVVADIVTDGIELYVSEGLLTRWDAAWIYYKMGRAMNWKDLLPRKRTTIPDKLRHVLHFHRFWGYHKPKKGKRKRSSAFKSV
jgi:hypothetical protein